MDSPTTDRIGTHNSSVDVQSNVTREQSDRPLTMKFIYTVQNMSLVSESFLNNIKNMK